MATQKSVAPDIKKQAYSSMLVAGFDVVHSIAADRKLKTEQYLISSIKLVGNSFLKDRKKMIWLLK